MLSRLWLNVALCASKPAAGLAGGGAIAGIDTARRGGGGAVAAGAGGAGVAGDCRGRFRGGGVAGAVTVMAGTAVVPGGTGGVAGAAWSAGCGDGGCWPGSGTGAGAGAAGSGGLRSLLLPILRLRRGNPDPAANKTSDELLEAANAFYDWTSSRLLVFI